MDKETILCKIKSEKMELENQIKMVEEFEIKPVTHDEWMKLCETPIRNSDLLIDVARETFPLGHSFKRNCNYITFCMDSFKVQIPTYLSKTIIIDSGWYRHDYKDYKKPQKRHLKMRKYFELLDSGEYTWYDLACCRNRYTNHYSKKQLFLWWFFKAKWHKVDREKWIKEFKKDDEYYQQSVNEQLETMKKVQENKLKFIECVEKLSEFGEVYTRMNFNGMYGAMVTAEEFINAMNK